MELKLRLNVAAVLQNAAGEILICERCKPAGAWQFPQGGVDEGETLEQAVAREMREEISLEPGDYTILERRGPYRYLFGGGRMVQGHHGKIQHYFLARLDAHPARINVMTAHPEFRDTRWVRPPDFKLKWLPEMKHEVYRAVFMDFFGVRLE
jgi:putative (di)nucleoside polyphosphate hydrolase